MPFSSSIVDSVASDLMVQVPFLSSAPVPLHALVKVRVAVWATDLPPPSTLLTIAVRAIESVNNFS